jgi:hypothetical protein
LAAGKQPQVVDFPDNVRVRFFQDQGNGTFGGTPEGTRETRVPPSEKGQKMAGNWQESSVDRALPIR